MKARFGGLPTPKQAKKIWQDIWYEEVHNSTALEGNVLRRTDVEKLLGLGKAVGAKDFKNYLEVRGYADAAQWVYQQALSPEGWGGEELLSLTEVRQVHSVTVAPFWEAMPPANALPDETPGNWRRHEIAQFESGLAPPPFTEIPALMTDWVRKAKRLKANSPELFENLAASHAAFERIHPFLDGNGRTGRLLANLLLVRLGYPPAIIYKKDRDLYLDALRKADHGDHASLAELLAKAVLHNLMRLVYPALAGRSHLVPLESLATKESSVAALRQAAARGRLRAVQGTDRVWRSTKQWVSDYRASKYSSLRKPRGKSYETAVTSGGGVPRVTIRTSSTRQT